MLQSIIYEEVYIELGTTLGLGRDLYICAQGDHGNIYVIFGFTMYSKQNDGQGVLHMK